MSSHKTNRCTVTFSCSPAFLETEEGIKLIEYQREHQIHLNVAKVIHELMNEAEHRDVQLQHSVAATLIQDAIRHAGGVKHYRHYSHFIDLARELIGDEPFAAPED